MKTKWKTIMKAMLGGLMLCFLMLLAVPSVESEAASKKPTCVKRQTVYMQYNENFFYDTPWYNLLGTGQYIFIKNLEPDAKITNIKSSNKKITAVTPQGKKTGTGEDGAIFLYVDNNGLF